MDLSTKENYVITPDGEAILKYYYAPSKVLYKARYNKICKDKIRLYIAVRSLINLGYVKPGPEGDELNISINVLGTEAVQQILKDNSRYYLPIIISIISLCFSAFSVLRSFCH